MTPLPREFERNHMYFVSAYELYRFIGFPKKKWTDWCRTHIQEFESLIENKHYYALELTAGEKKDNIKQNFAVVSHVADILFSISKPWEKHAWIGKTLHPGLKAVDSKSGKIKYHIKSHQK